MKRIFFSIFGIIKYMHIFWVKCSYIIKTSNHSTPTTNLASRTFPKRSFKFFIY